MHAIGGNANGPMAGTDSLSWLSKHMAIRHYSSQVLSGEACRHRGVFMLPLQSVKKAHSFSPGQHMHLYRR